MHCFAGLHLVFRGLDVGVMGADYVVENAVFAMTAGDLAERDERAAARQTAEAKRKFLYCPLHGDLLAGPRSARCADALVGHEFP